MKSRKNSILGLLCSSLLLFFIFANGIVISLKLSVFSGEGPLGLVKNQDFTEAVCKVIGRNSSGLLEKYGFTEDTFYDFMENEYVNKAIDITSNAILNDGGNVDFSPLKAETEDFCKNTSEKIVNEFVEQLDKNNGVINQTTVLDNSIVNAFENNFNINVNEEMQKTVQRMYPQLDTTQELDLSKVDKSQLKINLNDAVNEKIAPRLNELTDSVASKAEDIVGNFSAQLNNSYNIKNIQKYNDILVSNIVMVIVLLSLFIVFFFGIQFMFYTGDYKNIPFRNFSIVSILSSIGLFIISSLGVFAYKIIENKVIEVEGRYDFILEIIKNLMDGWFRNFAYVAGAVMIAGIISGILAVLVKPKRKFQ